MTGISSKAAGIQENKNQKFQGQKFDDDFGLSLYQFKWRNHDSQIGRFIEIDPLSDKYVYNSIYAFSENKVTGHVELEGLESVPTVGTAGPDGRFPVQGDYNGDGVVSASERSSWISAIGVWMTGALAVATMGRIPVSVYVNVFYNPVIQTEIVGGLAALAGYNGPEFPSPGAIMAQKSRVIFSSGEETVHFIMQKGSSFASLGEQTMAKILLSEGKNVTKIAEGTNKTFDFLIHGLPTEFKEISNITSKDLSGTIKKTIEKSFNQASNVIINVTNQKGATKKVMEETMSRVAGNNKEKDYAVRIIGDGCDLFRTNKK